MQVDTWEPLLFLLVTLVVMAIVIVVGYFKGLLWFQQERTDAAERFLVSFQERDSASGGWFRRFGRPAILLELVVIFSYPIVTNLFALSPFQFVVYVFAFYLPAQLALAIILFVTYLRFARQPEPNASET